jgi:hypothetical protein
MVGVVGKTSCLIKGFRADIEFEGFVVVERGL